MKLQGRTSLVCSLGVQYSFIVHLLHDYQIIIGSKSLHLNTLRGKNGLQAFGNNSAESEPIWMRCGKMCAKCQGLALTDVGHDPRSSDSSRGFV